MADELDQKPAIVLAGAKRLGALLGFPVEDFALVPETDLDLDEIRGCLWDELAGRHLDVVPGEREGSARIAGVTGEAAATPELGRSGDPS